MFSNRTGWIGVDIGNSAIKFAQVERRARKLSVRAAAIIKRPSVIDTTAWVRSSPVSSESEFKSAVKSAPFRGRDTACSAPIAVCDVRTMDVPSTEHAEIREFIASELSQIHSIPADNVHFDYWNNETGNSNEQTHVLCLADRWTEQIITDHRTNRLTCNAVDGLPQSLARATMLVENFNPNQAYAILDWGDTTSTFCVVINGQPIFTRCLPKFGFRSLQSKLSEALGMNRNETRRIISRFGLPKNEHASDDEVQLTVAEILSSDIENIVKELQTTIKFFGAQRKNIELEQGFIFGSGATLKNIEHWIGSKLKLSLQPWSLPVQNSENCKVPLALLGPAIASSTLVWEKS